MCLPSNVALGVNSNKTGNKSIIKIRFPHNGLDHYTQCWLKLIIVIFVILLISMVCLTRLYVRRHSKCAQLSYHQLWVDKKLQRDIPSRFDHGPHANHHYSMDVLQPGKPHYGNEHIRQIAGALGSASNNGALTELKLYLEENGQDKYGKLIEELNVSFSEILSILHTSNEISQHNYEMLQNTNNLFDKFSEIVASISQILIMIFTGLFLFIGAGICQRSKEYSCKTQREKTEINKTVTNSMILETPTTTAAAATSYTMNHLRTSVRNKSPVVVMNRNELVVLRHIVTSSELGEAKTPPRSPTSSKHSISQTPTATNSSRVRQKCQGWSVTTHDSCQRWAKLSGAYCYQHAK